MENFFWESAFASVIESARASVLLLSSELLLFDRRSVRTVLNIPHHSCIEKPKVLNATNHRNHKS